MSGSTATRQGPLRVIEDVIHRSYADEAAYLNELIAIPFFPERSVEARRGSPVESTAGETRITLFARAEARAAPPARQFRIRRDIVLRAPAGLGEPGRTGDAPGAAAP